MFSGDLIGWTAIIATIFRRKPLREYVVEIGRLGVVGLRPSRADGALHERWSRQLLKKL
jgi:hypothetical protein